MRFAFSSILAGLSEDFIGSLEKVNSLNSLFKSKSVSKKVIKFNVGFREIFSSKMGSLFHEKLYTF